MPGIKCHAALSGEPGMTKAAAESIRQRLLNLARERGENFDYVLRQYVIQRLLYRLSQTDYQKQFLLKGAQLFWLWNKDFHRPTRDVDLLGFGDNDVQVLVRAFQEICSVKIADGLQFDTGNIEGLEIKEDDMYQGVRITGFAELARARIPFQVDIGFGDIVTPEPEVASMPSFLDMPEAEIRVYPVYTVLAEKFQAMVYLGLANSRMKDFYDVWFIASGMDLDGTLLAEAIKATFARRDTSVTTAPLEIFEEAFAGDKSKNAQWNAFINKNALTNELTFANMIQKLKIFLEPIYQSIALEQPFKQKWSAQHWQ